MNIYVGNLPYNVQDAELRAAFEPYGAVNSVEVIFDRRTQRSRGYGFVEMENENEAVEAIEALNGSDFQGRELRVDESKPKEEKPSSRPRNTQGKRANNRSDSE
ncbi:MAG: RNA recognition motif-containing protein, partial [Gammaproteobacteria bacterium]